MKKEFSVKAWSIVSAGMDNEADWCDWAKGNRELSQELPNVQLSRFPNRISRRLDKLGKCMMFSAEQCLNQLPKHVHPSIISTSRHGDLPFMASLIRDVRSNEDISPTAFAYSVHNRFSSLVSMSFGFKGINGAYSSTLDGFPLALAEAISLLKKDPDTPVLILSYEPEIPPDYKALIKQSFKPHAGAFLLFSAEQSDIRYGLCRRREGVVTQAFSGPESMVSVKPYQPKSCQSEANASRGSCLSFVKTLMLGETVDDGHWQYFQAGYS